MAKSGVTAGLLPAGSAVVAKLDNGTIEVVVNKVEPVGDNPDDGFYAECVYPGGFTKDHQVKTSEELAPKIVNMLRGRYGVVSVNITTLPKLGAGITIEAEVANG